MFIIEKILESWMKNRRTFRKIINSADKFVEHVTTRMNKGKTSNSGFPEGIRCVLGVGGNLLNVMGRVIIRKESQDKQVIFRLAVSKSTPDKRKAFNCL